MNKPIFPQPVVDEELSDDANLCVELPELDDLENPALQRAIDRVKEAKQSPSAAGHQRHSSHDRKGGGGW